jgi:hypothetical protein
MAYNLQHIDPEDRIELYADRRDRDDAPRFGRLRRLGVAIAVMGVFAGGLWFAYTEGMRHAVSAKDSADIPLIQADTRPFKLKPQNPGGMQRPDRDLLIYGEPRPQVEHLLPPPEQPMARPTPPPAAPPLSPPQASTAVAALPAAAPSSPTQSPGPPDQVRGRGGEGNRGGAPTLASPPSATASAAHENAQIGRPQAPGAAPQPGPDWIAQKIEQIATANLPKPAAAWTSSARAGRLWLQLGAVRSESLARGEWQRLKRNNRDLLGNLSGVAVRADLGDKGVYYRIQAGPIADPSTADRVCGALRQRHLACMIVR